ncbi:MAG: lysoplasmalogenase [Sphingomonas sp.]|uniref:lysoplasmalogenase family protein n=1 Tax=Sphingomonas sp. TaxID=28214 RepID=UPI001224FE49|nr:lysoplasmalogenase family protein [Sphingomonas sp.]THD36537.1 MAG: lysoplasmalogenase [Sphingomonas sp.]
MSPTGPKFNLLFAAALVAGVSFWIGRGHVDPTPLWVAWKGGCVAFLALWAALNARNRDGWQIAAALALGALGDVVLEHSQAGGGGAFLAGHIVAAALYWRHRRMKRSPSQTALAILLVVVIPLIAFLLPSDRTAAPLIAVYALGLGVMTGSAWASTFPRYRLGIGAVMFAASDLLIFAKLGPLAASSVPGALIWPLYFLGQSLIAWGVVTTLLRWQADEDLHHRL